MGHAFVSSFWCYNTPRFFVSSSGQAPTRFYAFSFLPLMSFTEQPFFNFYSMLFIVIILGLILVKLSNNILFSNIYFIVISAVTITSFSLLSFAYPKFSFCFMMFVTCFLMAFTLPLSSWAKYQKHFLIKVLIFLDKTLILDFFSVIFVKFFCVPTKKFIQRLVIIFCINILYILCCRGVFIRVVFWQMPLFNDYTFLINIILFAGICVIYFRLLISLSMFLVYSTKRLEPSLLSPSILYILGDDDSIGALNKEISQPKASLADRKFTFINVSLTRNYYRQYFNDSHPNGFKYMSFGVLFFGTLAACGTLWYTRTQAITSVQQVEQARIQTEQARIQAEQSVKQTYHTAREADVAAVEAKIISLEEYYRRHPEDKT